MADDLYEALIGGGADNPEKSALIAAALRRRNQLGQLGILTGDKVLSETGKGLSKSSDEYAESLQQIRQDNSRQKQTKAYQDAQLGHMDSVLKETIRNNNLDYMAAMAMANAAQTRADRAGQGKIPKLRQGDIKDMQSLGDTIGAIQGLQDFMEGGGSIGATMIGNVPIPGGRSLKNTMASYGFGSEEDKASFTAKQTWDRMYNLAQRNALFGATLTPAELKSWADANPSGTQTDAQIAAALPIMKKIFQHRLDKKARGLMKEGYSADAIGEYADIPGVNLPQEVGGDVTPSKPTKPLRKINGKWTDAY